ncbi:MAG TPA: dihydrofolate reductase family protein [Mucilaginibacter sp.]
MEQLKEEKIKSNQMRKLIFAINLTLDGCCDHTKGIADEELHDYHTALLRDADTFLYGRKTYQLMVPFWPNLAKDHSTKARSMSDFARAFNAINQIVVFSKSLDKAEGKNTRIVRGNLRDEVLKLKQEQGRNILTGGVDIPSQLIELGLVDEYHFVVQPLMAGEGRRLLKGVSLPELLKLKLIDTKIFKSGCVALHYSKS